MRYVTAVFILALALPLSAQTPEIDALEAELASLNRQITKLKAAENFKSLTLEADLITMGYSISADTLDAQYVVLAMPSSLQREADLLMRENGIKFIKTGDKEVIRLRRDRLPKVEAVLPRLELPPDPPK